MNLVSALWDSIGKLAANGKSLTDYNNTLSVLKTLEK